jgi:hypothetical protein
MGSKGQINGKEPASASPPPTSSASGAGSTAPAEREVVNAALERILGSPGFRNSKQCQRFLSYVLQKTMEGEDDLLHERTIGIEVFGRPPDYDTSEDPVVRVRANEVRKRLAQYYVDTGAADPIRLELPAGAYKVDLRTMAVPPSEADLAGVAASQAARTVSTDARRWRAVAGLIVVIGAVALALVLLWPKHEPPTALQSFWAPVLESPQPVLVYCGQPIVYFLSRSVHEKYRERLSAEQRRGSYVIRLDPNAVLRGRDVIPVPDQFVGIGNAHTAARLSALFARLSKPVEIRFANDLSFSDLRGSPAVLVGAFSNFWTLEITDRLRFVFEQEGSLRRIRDTSNGRTWELQHIAPDGKTPEDYAIVSRLLKSESGKAVITAAGITQYGTRAAGEFLTDAGGLEEALARAAEDWPSRNMQVLLQTSVFQGTPGPPKVVAIHSW